MPQLKEAEDILIKPRSNDLGLDHALKIREILLKDEHTRVSLEAQIEPFYKVWLRVHPFNGLYAELPIQTYYFKEDGTYSKVTHP